MPNIWIYQSSRDFTVLEKKEISEKIDQFTLQWVSHNQALKASGHILYNRFIILQVNSTSTSASGCSIDSSVKFIQELGQTYHIDFFDRLTFAYLKNDQIQFAHKNDFSKLYNEGVINDHTIVFNNLVNTQSEFENQWKIPLKESWHKKFISN